MSGRGPGRPYATFRKDIERHAVALTEAQIRFAPARGVTVSERLAAKHAAAALGYFDTKMTQHYGMPPTEYAGANLRKSPTQPALRMGYCELTVTHIERPNTTAHQFNKAADRLIKKVRAWKKRPDGAAWLEHMAHAWACALYPRMIAGIWRRDPTMACRRAAEWAGELDFAEKVLLPHLHDRLREGHR